MKESYDLEWFEKRAHESLKQIESGVWDFSDSALLYTPEAVEGYEEIQQVDNNYHSTVTAPETKLLKGIADDVVKELPDNFYYVDLGPGTEHKEKVFFDAAKEQGKEFIYYPIDVSKHILDSASTFAYGLDIEPRPIQASFEECAKYLPKDKTHRFVSLGLTFVNYHVKDVLELLGNIIGSNGSAFITIHARDRVDMKLVREIYLEQFEPILFKKISLLGLDPEKDVENVDLTDGVQMWCDVINPSEPMQQKGIKKGDRLLVFQSLRRTLDEWLDDIKNVFPNISVFDNGLPFVGLLLKK